MDLAHRMRQLHAVSRPSLYDVHVLVCGRVDDSRVDRLPQYAQVPAAGHMDSPMPHHGFRILTVSHTPSEQCAHDVAHRHTGCNRPL